MRFEGELSPLDQIRQTEAEVTRRIAAAREAAQGVVEGAHEQATQRVEGARTAGDRAGQARYKEMISKAEEEARAISLQAEHRAERLHQRGRRRMEQAVAMAVALVTGQESGDNRP